MTTKILLLTPQTPYPPDQGAAIRNFSFVRYLGSDPRYELRLLSFARPGEDPATTPARAVLEKYCREVVLVPHPPMRTKISRLRELLSSTRPDLTRRLLSNEFETALQALTRSGAVDLIQCEGLELAHFLAGLNFPLGERQPRMILDEHNAEYLLQRRIYENDWRSGWKRRPAALYSLVQARRLARYERASLARFERVVAVSEADRQALARLDPRHSARLAIIPNGLDLEEFQPLPDKPEEEPDRLVFTGTMDFRPNVDAVTWFVREVWPLVRVARPLARFTIVGRRPAPAVQFLARLPGIEVTGVVADARPYIRRSSLYVVPMRMGGGVRYKVLESLAMGKAVVTTTMGADGIPLRPGREALVADSPADFAAAILALLGDPTRRAELAGAGRAFVEAYFDWRKIVPLLDEVLLERKETYP